MPGHFRHEGIHGAEQDGFLRFWLGNPTGRQFDENQSHVQTCSQLPEPNGRRLILAAI